MRSVKEKICIGAIATNMLLWLIIFFIYFISYIYQVDVSYRVFYSLIYICEILIHVIVLIGIIKRIKLLYYGGIIFFFINTVFSLIDELGCVDILSFLLSLGVFLSLLLTKRELQLQQ